MQRRHQKVVEEAPAPGLSDQLRADMAAAAMAATRAIAYVGAGTFEFLVEGDDFYFLEMNTRLQVEHPVTELVTGLDLVRLQLEVAAGEPLGVEDGTILDARGRGHAVEARLYAEDPAAGWLPSPGTLTAFAPGPTPVRWDSGVAAGSVVSAHMDPMLAKAVAHAPTRREALARLGRALDELVVHGVRTNRDFLVDLLAASAVRSGTVTTAFIDEHPELTAAGPDAEVLRWHTLAATVHDVVEARRTAAALGFAPPGWRNVRSAPLERCYLGPAGAVEVRYRFEAGEAPVVHATIDGVEVTARVLEATGGVVDLETAEARRRFAVHAPGGAVLHVDGGGFAHSHSSWTAVPRFHESDGAAAGGGGVAAEIPGVVTAVSVRAGETVALGQRLVAMEAMKMEHAIAAPFDAVVDAVHVAVGQQVEAHEVLVTLTPAVN